jgi:hypothetical protein
MRWSLWRRPIALLVNPTSPALSEPTTRDLQAAARLLGLNIHVLHAATELDFDRVFTTMAQLRASLAQFAFGELVKNGILPKDHAEHLLRQAIETHATAGPGNRAAAELLAVVWQSLSAIQPPTRQ